jgi:hypothetical protein
VSAYNFTVSVDNQIRSRDLIESVNGVTGSAAKMIEELCSASIAELVVLRVPAVSSC